VSLSWVVFQQVAGLFIYIGAGYAARFFGILEEEGDRAVSNLLNYVTMPALLLTSMQLEPTARVLRNTGVVLALAFSLVLAAFGLSEVLGRAKGLSPLKRYAFQTAFTFGNVAYLGFPVINALYGSEGLYYAAIFTLAHNVIFYTLGVWLMNRHRESRVSWRLLLNPVIMAIGLGFFLNLFRLNIPALIWQPLTNLGAVTIPLALFLVGTTLADAPLRSIFRQPLAYGASVGKVLLLPLLTLPLLTYLPVEHLVKVVVVLEMGMPVAAVTTALGRAYGSDYVLLTNSVAISTLLSLVSIPFLTWLMF